MNTSYEINDSKIDAAIQKWNSLTSVQKMEFGDLMITHESNLRAWDKDFGALSAHKMECVVGSILNWAPPGKMII
jgi:hypothetical protein